MNQEVKKSGSSLWLILILIVWGALGAFFFWNKSNTPTTSVKPLPKAASVQDIKWDVVYTNMIDKVTSSLQKNMDLIASSKGVESVVNFVIGLEVPQQFKGEMTIDSTLKNSFKTFDTESRGKISVKGSTLQEPVINFDGSLEWALISTSKELFVRLDDVKINMEGQEIQPMQTAMIQGMLSGFLSQYGKKRIRIDLSGVNYTSTNIDPTNVIKFVYGFFDELKKKPILVVESENLVDNKKEFILAFSAENINSLIDYVVNDPVWKQLISSSGQPITEEDIKQLKEEISQTLDEANWRGKAIVDVNYSYEIILPLYSWSWTGDITGSAVKIYPDRLELVINEADAQGTIVWEAKNGKNIIKWVIRGKDMEGKETDLVDVDVNIDYKVKGKDVITKWYAKIKFISPQGEEAILLEFNLDEKDSYVDKDVNIQIPTDFVNIEEILGDLGGFGIAPGVWPANYDMAPNPAIPQGGEFNDVPMIEIQDMGGEWGPVEVNVEELTPEQLQQLQQQFAQ